MIDSSGYFAHRRGMQWLKAYAALVMVASAADRVVINEIHFDPSEKLPLEFVELHNPGDAPVNLAGWRFEKFVFPSGATIEPGGFFIIAQDPAEFQKAFGKPAVGPLPGKLSNEGEKLTLLDANGRVVEQFSYGVEFPWPSASAGAGSSLERIHPDATAAEPGSWRASGFATTVKDSATCIPAGAVWRYP